MYCASRCVCFSRLRIFLIIGYLGDRTVGLSYTTQIRHHTIPMDESDKALDALVTANGVIQMNIEACQKKYTSDIKC